jgi:hypothetical protein
VGLIGEAVGQHSIPSNNKWTHELEQSISRQTMIEQLLISIYSGPMKKMTHPPD